MRRPLRIISAPAVFALVLAACGSGVTGPEPVDTGAVTTVTGALPAPQNSPDDTAGGSTSTSATSASPPEGPSALDAAPNGLTGDGFPEPLIDTSRLIQGQVPDGIPAIDTPRFIDVPSADDWLADDEPVVVLDVNGDVRAYPVQILIWHEIVNDVVGDLPVAITYCPLCNSAVTYERRVGGHPTTFGTSGFLFNSALVMYDRATESLWTHFNGTAVAGVRTGIRLKPVSSPLLAWSDFRAAHPAGLVLDVERTGHNRPYGSNPYVGYDDPASFPFLFDGEVDERANAKDRVIGVNIDGVAVAWRLDEVAGAQSTVTPGTVGGVSVVILWKPGQSSALDASGIASGRDVGSVGVFLPELDGSPLTLEPGGDGFVDAETGTEWNILGEAVAGPRSGAKLEAVPHLDTFWFAWLAYNPATALVES